MAKLKDVVYGNTEQLDKLFNGQAVSGHTYNENDLYIEELGDEIELGATGSGTEINANNQLVLTNEQYKLIETITLTEATNEVRRSQTPLGKNYNFKKMLIEVITPAVATQVTGNIGVNYGSGMKVYCIAFYIKTTICRNVCELKVENGIFSASGYNSHTTSGYGASATMIYLDGAFQIATTNITDVRIYANGIPTGTTINIYGIWA